MEFSDDPEGKALANLRDRITQSKLADKYNGKHLFDDEEVEEREIFNVDWVNRKGYQVVTQLVGFEGDTD